MPDWYVYIVKCSDETYYTGISNDISRRISEHNLGNGAKYIKGRTPVVLVYTSWCINKSDALKKEYKIKKMKRSEKEILVKKFFTSCSFMV